VRELVIVGADQDGRWQRRPEHRAQTAQGLRPVVWGHPMIQQQHVVAASRRLLCHCALDSRGRVVEVVDLQPEHLQLLAQRQARFGEVVHQQRALSPQRRSRGVVVALDLQFGSEPEAAAGTGPAVDSDLATHHFRDLAGQRQPQAGTAMAPGDLPVGLLEGFKQSGLSLRRHTDAGVAHIEAQQCT